MLSSLLTLLLNKIVEEFWISLSLIVWNVCVILECLIASSEQVTELLLNLNLSSDIKSADHGVDSNNCRSLVDQSLIIHGGE